LSEKNKLNFEFEFQKKLRISKDFRLSWRLKLQKTNQDFNKKLKCLKH